MAIQDSTFKTTHVMDNEIIKASDLEFAFEQVVENVSKATQLMLESNQDFVINGTVSPYSDMTVQVAPIYGVCKSTGQPFGRTETASLGFGFDESETGRVDILEVQGDWLLYDNQQRAFNDPDTDTNTYQYVNTKKLLQPVYKIVKGTEGSSVAPDKDDGWVKLAEVVIRAGATEIEESDIKNITSDIAGVANTGWTAETTATYNIGYISDINKRFRVQHNQDGTHKNDVINTDSLNIGTGAKQVNGNVLPIGGSVSIPTQTVSSTDTILSVISKAATMITSLYNAYLLFDGAYKFNGELCLSAIADPDSKVLTNPLKLSAAGDGTAVIKIGNSTVLSITSSGKLVTNGYSVVSGDSLNTIVTKAVTDAIKSDLTNLAGRVSTLEGLVNDTAIYTNGVLSRYTVYSSNILVATTSNIVSLSGEMIIDGETPTDGNYILVKDQTDATENGIYQYSSNSVWSRVNTFLTPNSLKGKIFNVIKGNTNGGKMFYVPNEYFEDGDDFGTDDINFLEYLGSVLPKASKVAVRDTSGRLQTSNSASDKDAVNRAELLAMLHVLCPVGTVTAYYGTTDPEDWFICDGRDTTGTANELSTNYPSLYAVLGSNVLPDLRNRTIMGANPDVTGKAAGNTSDVGDVQTAQLPNIKGNVRNAGGTFGIFGFDASISQINGAFSGSNFKGSHRSGEGSASGAKEFWMNIEKGGTTASTDHLGNNVYYGDFDNSTVANRTYGETRAANIRMNYIIRAR